MLGLGQPPPPVHHGQQFDEGRHEHAQTPVIDELHHGRVTDHGLGDNVVAVRLAAITVFQPMMALSRLAVVDPLEPLVVSDEERAYLVGEQLRINRRQTE